jgi:hypothetical protein
MKMNRAGELWVERRVADVPTSSIRARRRLCPMDAIQSETEVRMRQMKIRVLCQNYTDAESRTARLAA